MSMPCFWESCSIICVEGRRKKERKKNVRIARDELDEEKCFMSLFGFKQQHEKAQKFAHKERCKEIARLQNGNIVERVVIKEFFCTKAGKNRNVAKSLCT